MLADRLRMGGKKIGSALFLSPGTYSFTVPAGVTEVKVLAIGGGGGAGVGISPNGAGGAGGAGAVFRATRAVSPGDTFSLDVGYGNYTNGANGDPGTASRATYNPTGAYIQGGGGAGGTGAGGGAGGTGGTGGAWSSSGSGWTTILSAAGGNGQNGTGGVAGGSGGATPFSATIGGVLINSTGGTGDATGTASFAVMSGSGYGSGGGGSFNRTFPTAYFGGKGADGCIAIEWGY
jgi:hypothetical protein